MCCISTYDFLKALLDISALLVSIATLVLAWKIYQNFDVKKQYVNKQLDTVTNLSTEITNTKVYVSFYRGIPEEFQNHGHTHVLEAYKLDFFSLKSINKNVDKFEKVYVRASRMNQIFSFLDYMSNPVLPSTIAKKLNDLHKYIEYSICTPKEELPNNYILLSPVSRSENEKLFFTYEYKSREELRECVTAVHTAIIEWLKKYGAEDINL